MKRLLPLVILLALAFCPGCSQSTGTPSQASQADDLPTQAQQKLRTMKLWLGPEEIEAELALTAREQQTGVMFRTNFPEGTGMLFPLPETQRAAFWMKNCPIPISAAYIDPQGYIQEVHEFEAQNTKPVVSASPNIRFVLEAPKGWFDRHHIGRGVLIRTERGSLMDTFFGR